MVKVLGIDPGTGSMDLLALNDETGKVLIDQAVPRHEVTRDPSIILHIVKKLHNNVRLDAIVAPSGYGIPLKRVQDAEEWEIMHATFVHCRDQSSSHQILGLRKLMLEFRDSTLPAWFTPGAAQLPTIPHYRKVNRIDMGTADKIYTVAASLARERTLGQKPGDMNIIVVEAGMAYTSALLVEAGQITDAIAGTAGFWGFLGAGFMDSELAYALAAVAPSFAKRVLFQGGASSIYRISTPEEMEALAAKGDPRGLGAARMIAEAIAKAVAALAAGTEARPRRVYLSGRLTRLPTTRRLIEAMVTRALPIPVRIEAPLRLGQNTKEGASGAAIIASGIAGGRYSWVIDVLRLRESRGTVFDNALLGDLARDMKEYFARPCRD